ncbi:Cystinosin-like [Vitis vinifera]|uniref:Cystinosin-like n=1 Tax=Vitis vinifera TaxID=29760 RepID=A0A438CR73_VITVI|nr:Cystinosin-like [Vitis vinifera]
MASWNSTSLEIVYQVFGWTAFVSWSISFYPQVILNFRRKSVVGLNFDFVVLNLTKHSSYLIYNAVLYFSSAVQRQYREKYGIGQSDFFYWEFHNSCLGDAETSNEAHVNNLTWIPTLYLDAHNLELGVGLGNAIGFGSPWWWALGFLTEIEMIPVAANDVAFSIHAVILTAFTLFQIAIYERGTQRVSKISIGIVSAAWLSAAVCVIIAFPNHSWLWLISVFKELFTLTWIGFFLKYEQL